MDNNFFGNLFRPLKKTSGKETALSLPELYPTPEFRGLKSWINTPPIQSLRQLLGGNGTDCFLGLLLRQLPERNDLV